MSEESPAPDSPREAIDQISGVVRRLQTVRKVFWELERLLSASDPLVDDLRKKLEKLADVSNSDSLGALIPLAVKELDRYRSRIEEIKRKRSDVRARREEFVRIARDAGWVVQSTGTADFVGPFKIQHDERTTIVFFAKFRVKRISYPSGATVLDTLKKVSEKMEDDALKGWGEFVDSVVATQERISATEPVPWGELFASIVPDKAQQKRLGRLFCYRLSLLISGKAPGGWKAVTVPPALAEQRFAWRVPRLDRPNDVVRVHRLRLKRMMDRTVDAGEVSRPPAT